MGPKKKEEEIDLTTLPECTSLNIILLAKGKKSRASNILEKVQQNGLKFMIKIKKNDVLDHAKEKSIYIDPNSLTDKQKKDPKFMESVNTELTAEVIAKATQSLIGTHILKARIEKKNNPNDKGTRPYDLLFVFQDFPETKDEFQELSKLKENIKFVLTIEPRISWANAPQIQQNGEEQGQEDEQVKQYKALLKKQERVQDDIQLDKKVQKRLSEIRQCRSKSNLSSEVRNCTISILQPEIDPFSEENSIKELVTQFFEHINTLNASLIDFQQWKQGRKAQKILDQAIKVQHQATQGSTISEMLASFAQSLDPSHDSSQNDEEDSAILDLINGFSTSKVNSQVKVESIQHNKQKQQVIFVQDNERREDGELASQIRKNIRYPGIDRYLMPEIPTKSQKLRKLQESQYTIFLKKGMNIDQMLRRLQILNFQQFIKQFDQERAYKFGDRIYQEHHDKESLQRQLHKALQLNEYNVFSKYDDNSDRLYLMLLYKNNPRRINRKLWESNWKVIPNYQSWLKYFKNNEINYNNGNFFDIDYEKIGSLEENTRCFSLKSGKSGAVIINKECTVSNATQSLLYAIKGNLTFGLQNSKFFAQHQQSRIFHYYIDEGKREVQTLISLDGFVIRVMAGGNLVIQKDGETKMITSTGYTIIYRNQQSPAILHPNGSVTYDSNTYTNDLGYGLKDGHLYTCPTLKRKTQQGEIIKRDDNTTILNYMKQGTISSQWIRFFDGTEYQVQNNTISIQKEGHPFVKCFNGNMQVITDKLSIRITKRFDSYTTIIQFEDGNSLRFADKLVYAFHVDQLQEIAVNIDANEIGSKFGNEKLTVSKEKAELERDGKRFDARQEQQKYVEADVLPADFIEPRLFIIDNDSTGFEILSQETIERYLKENQSAIDKVYEKKNGDKVEKYIVAKRGRVQGKFIKNKLTADLDVFSNASSESKPETYKYISLKSLIKYSPLQQQDVTQLQAIKAEVEEWKRQNIKEENQYGHKPKNDPSTKTKMQNKLLTTKKRQEKINKVNSSSLRETAKNFHLITYEEINKELEKQSKEKRMRNEFKNKRDSIKQEYKRVFVQKEHEEQVEDQKEGYQPFMDNYFMTNQGKRALSEMPEWVFRPKEIKPAMELDAQIKNELNNTSNINKEESEQAKERYDTVQVNLNPKGQKQIYIKPSVFTQRQIDEERTAFESEKKAYKYHQAKRKDFNVYGIERKYKPEVPTLLRTQPISEINQKYLVVEAPLDNKVKTSSMKNKLTSSASNMVEMRKEGPHSLLIKTLDKGNDINKLLEKRTMMVQADLNDKLQRDILINPIQANFGTLHEKKTYKLKITIKNQDVISQRITLKRPRTIYAKAAISEMGPIAMGMTRKVIVTLKASPEILGKFNDEFEIVTKHEIYHIPISAHIVSEGQWRAQTCAVGKGVTEVDELQTSRKKQSTLELPKIK